MNLLDFIEHGIQIFIIVIAFHSESGIRHVGQMEMVFTDEDACEVYAKQVMFENYRKIPGLYWYCQQVQVNP